MPSAGPVSSGGGGSRGLMRGCVSGRTAGEAHSLIWEFGWGRLPRQYFSGLQQMGLWALSLRWFSGFHWTVSGLTRVASDTGCPLIRALASTASLKARGSVRSSLG